MLELPILTGALLLVLSVHHAFHYTENSRFYAEFSAVYFIDIL